MSMSKRSTMKCVACATPVQPSETRETLSCTGHQEDEAGDIEDRRGASPGLRVGGGLGLGGIRPLVLSLVFKRHFFSLLSSDPGAARAQRRRSRSMIPAKPGCI